MSDKCKRPCFANHGNKCYALSEAYKPGVKCPFQRNDITWAQVKADISLYNTLGGEYDKEGSKK